MGLPPISIVSFEDSATKFMGQFAINIVNVLQVHDLDPPKFPRLLEGGGA